MSTCSYANDSIKWGPVYTKHVPFGGLWEGFWGSLGGVLGSLGGHLGVPGVNLGPVGEHWGLKTLKSRFLHDLGIHLGGKIGLPGTPGDTQGLPGSPQGPPKGPKIEPTWQFWEPFWSLLGHMLVTFCTGVRKTFVPARGIFVGVCSQFLPALRKACYGILYAFRFAR